MVLVWPPIFYRPANYEEHENHLKNDGRKKREKENEERKLIISFFRAEIWENHGKTFL